jgi:tetratricopeptide (TPR) repeat protein
VVQFNYGTVLFCAGYLTDADAAYRAAKKAGRDTYYEIQSDLILHPQYFTKAGYPPFLSESHDPLLVQGAILQRAGHQHSAQRVWAKAARLHPGSDEAQVAAAVGRFDMDDLSASFSRLGPLVRKFPESQSVRYHLGLLLAWTGQRDQAITEFRLARSLGPKTSLGKEANTFLGGLVTGGTKGTQR